MVTFIILLAEKVAKKQELGQKIVVLTIKLKTHLRENLMPILISIILVVMMEMECQII